MVSLRLNSDRQISGYEAEIFVFGFSPMKHSFPFLAAAPCRRRLPVAHSSEFRGKKEDMNGDFFDRQLIENRRA